MNAAHKIADETDLITPDFYTYDWVPLVAAELADGFVTARWADGAELRCYSLWLAENSFGIEPRTRESTIDPADLPDPSALLKAGVGVSGSLELDWVNGTHSRVHPGWLHHVALGQYTPEASLPEISSWTSETFDQPPTVDGETILDDESNQQEWLTALCQYGLARLVNTPATREFMEELGRTIGPIRGSNFGDVFDVRAKIAPDSTANTGLNLGQHADLPTRETPPGFQFLHCIENEVPGGWSRMTDGLSIVAELADQHREDFEALTTLQWTFVNRSTFADHRWTGPIIDNLDTRYPLTMRAFYPVRAFPNMEPADQPRGYAAMRTFSRLAHDPRFQIRFPFSPGDLVGFDNRRVLHGRDAFDTGGGARWLRGCYLDQDDVYSRLRVLSRRESRLAK